MRASDIEQKFVDLDYCASSSALNLIDFFAIIDKANQFGSCPGEPEVKDKVKVDQYVSVEAKTSKNSLNILACKGKVLGSILMKLGIRFLAIVAF